MTEATGKYVLGADDGELVRLAHQHQVWRPLSEAAFDRIEVQPGWAVLDAGCGPGFVLEDLHDRVGEEGELHGIDLEEPMLALARQRLAQRDWNNVQLSQGDLNDCPLPAGHFDMIWLRWVLSFPKQPERILERLLESLKPGGYLAIQDYNHEGVSLFPESAGFHAAVRATRELYAQTGGDPWFGARLPGLFRQYALETVHYRADVITGSPGEPAFEWADQFFPDWTERFVARGLMTAEELSLIHI